MTELMKRYEAETGEKAVDEYTEYANDEYVRWLEAQLRWRKVGEEQLDEDKVFFVKELHGKVWYGNFVEDRGAYLFICSNGKFIPSHKIEGYLPVPRIPAPEGE